MIATPPVMLQPPAIIRVQTVAPNAGAAGQSDAATSAVPSTRPATKSLTKGNMAGAAVPGGVNHAPNRQPKAGSFSGPIQK